MNTEYPNILIIMSDEHTARAMGCMGCDYVLTPNLDRLAQHGTLFENCYCNYAVCVPSRSSFMAGRQCHNIAAYDNSSPLASDVPTWAHMLASVDYHCILDGKMHFLGPDQLHGFHEHWTEPGHKIGGSRWGDEKPSPTAYQNWSRLTILPHEELDIRDFKVHQLALDYLDQKAYGHFCLTASYIFPHYPQICSQEAYDAYANIEIPAPIPADYLNERNRYWREKVWSFDKMNEKETVEARRVYLAMVTMFDTWVGELLDKLESQKRLDDTLIIYLSDHGDMMGEHGMWGKNLFYDDSSRVPLIISAPGLGLAQGKRVRTPVSLIDIYPTLKEFCGLDSWDAVLDGRSLLGACRDGGQLDDQPVYCEYSGSDIHKAERMVRYNDYKYNYYSKDLQELFDMSKDPNETQNLCGREDLKEVEAKLKDMLFDDWDPDEMKERVLASQVRRSLVGRSKVS